MLVDLGHIFLYIECALALICGIFFWYFWSHSLMHRPTVVKAVIIYTLGCLVCLAFSALALL